MTDLLREAERLLRLLRKPVHYEHLYALIKDERRVELKPVGSKPPSYELYAALYFELREVGTPFVKVARGVYALKEFADGSYEVPAKRPNGEAAVYRPAKGKPIRLKEGEQPTCGTCRHLEMSETDLFHMDGGTCGRYEQSKRGGVAACRKACPVWEIRTAQQRRKDLSERARLRELIEAANSTMINFDGRKHSS